MVHKGFYLMEHKDTKTQRIRQTSAKGSALKVSSLFTQKNFVPLCLCVQFNNTVTENLCVLVSLCSVIKIKYRLI